VSILFNDFSTGFSTVFQPFFQLVLVSAERFLLFLNGTIQNFDINKTITGNNKEIGCFFSIP
jgi:hypothetical protein